MDAYMRRRKQYSDKSSSLSVLAATDDTTLITSRGTGWTIYVQKIHTNITGGSAGKTWLFKDSAGTPIPVGQTIDAATAHEEIFDFGPDGIPLTAAKNFLLDVSAAGASGQIVWYAYEKLTSTISTATSPSLS